LISGLWADFILIEGASPVPYGQDDDPLRLPSVHDAIWLDDYFSDVWAAQLGDGTPPIRKLG